MSKIRVAAVEYLNALPLVHGLDARPELFTMQYDVPARCAALLHAGSVDLGLIPSIEYLQQPDYRIVPGIAVASDGPVASVALFSKRPATALRSIAVDASSRTANALLRILCAQWFDIDPTFVKMHVDLDRMLKRCDAALVIGDRALFIDHEAAGLEKIDLGEEWSTMTGMPFVWAVWAGRPNVVGPEHLAALQAARDAGVAAREEIARRFTAANDDEEKRETVRGYLENHIECVLDERRVTSLGKFYEKAHEIGVVPATRPLRFYAGADS